jgi:hypothetical protein
MEVVCWQNTDKDVADWNAECVEVYEFAIGFTKWCTTQVHDVQFW